MNAKVNLLDYDRPGLEAFFVNMSEKGFRASQVVKWLHQERVDNFDVMTNLSKDLRKRLSETAEIRVPEIVFDQVSTDGTRKWLFRLDDGNCIETVFIPERERGTLCISSQIGCTLNCSFCSTARQGFNRNLSLAEIISQLWVAYRTLEQSGIQGRAITNIVFMGMGEPLLNFDNVIKAMNLMMDDLAYGLSKRRITLSTAGVVPGIDRLREVCDVSLAVSLHATNNELRDQIVPLNRKYPIRELLDACKRYLSDKSHRSKITFEYVMLAGVNDSLLHARQLAKLLKDVPAKVNLIPFNPFPGADYQTSEQSVIDRFQSCLIDAGIVTVMRRTRGDDIDAACGQLVGKVNDRTRRSAQFNIVMEKTA